MKQKILGNMNKLVLSFFVALFSFFFLHPGNIYAATGTFKVSDYGTGQTSSTTSQYYRGYVFRVSQEVVISDLIAGGGGSVYSVGIYTVDVIGGGTSVKPTALIGYASTTTAGANQVLSVTNGNSDGGTTITLEPGTDYLLASGKNGGTTGNHWVVTNLDVENILATPLIASWGPTVGGFTYRWNGITGAPSSIVNQTTADIQGNTLPMLGFSYATNADLPQVTSNTPTFNGSTAHFNGQIDDTGDADTAEYVEWGHQSNLSDGTLASLGTLDAGDSVPAAFSYNIFDDISPAAGTYYYRALGINVAGRTNGSILGPYTAYNVTYSAGSNGSISGTSSQVIWNGESSSAVTAVADSGYAFVDWSDGSTQNPRSDVISGTLSVTANFDTAPELTPTPTPTGGPSNNNTSSPSAPSCSDAQPSGTPDLFQIDINNTQAILYFAPANGANKYYIAYGNGDTTEQYGVEFDSGVSSGVLSYTINLLSPNTQYSFKVRGENGCMPGNWGNTMQSKTKSSSSGGTTYYKNLLTRILSIFPKQVTDAGATPTSTNPQPAGSGQYTVQSGDSLWNISLSQCGTPSYHTSIMQQNGLSSSLIHPGQVLKFECQ